MRRRAHRERRVHEADVEPRQLLVYFLRETLGLKGTNIGCDTSRAAPAPSSWTVSPSSPARCSPPRPTAARSRRSRASPRRTSCIRCRRHSTSTTGCSAASARRASSWRRCRFCGRTRPDGERDPARARGQPLPLHRLSQHRPRGAGRREGERMIPAAFDYERADTVEEALELLGTRRGREAARRRPVADADDEASARAAGGARRRRPARRLRYVRDDGDQVAIGALTRHHDVARPVLRDCAAARARRRRSSATRRCAIADDRRLGRTRGSGLRSPGGAARARRRLVARGPDGERTSRRGVLHGPFETALGPRSCSPRSASPRSARRLPEARRRAQDWATVGVAAVEGRACGSGSRAWARRRCGRRGVEEALARGAVAAEAAAAGRRRHAPPSDMTGSADYREHLAQVLRPRALELL